MRWLQQVLRAVRSTRDDQAIDSELRLHTDLETADLVAQGVPPETARRRALLALGGVERFRTEAREARRGRWLTILPSELLWAWRGVRGRGLGSLFHIGLVGLTIAASAVVFSATDAYVFRPVPYPNANRLVMFRHTRPGLPTPMDVLESQELLAWRRYPDLFSSVHAHNHGPVTYVTISGVTESVKTEVVTPGLFEMLGVRPQWGRSLVSGDEQPGQPAVVLLREDLARRLYVDPSHAVNQYLTTGRESLLVVGVMPASFRFPSALEQMWRPLQIDGLPAQNGTPLYKSLALTAPGASLESVMRGVAARRASIPHSLNLGDASVIALTEVKRDARSTLFVMLLGSAICLLFVACLNVAGLELTAAIGRTRAYAVHTALGAARSSLVRTGLMEGVLLTGIGALVAIGLASWGTAFLTALLPPALTDTVSNPIDLDLRVVAFMTIVTIGTWIVTATPVVWRASRPNVTDGLRHDARSTTTSRVRATARHVLMASQVALTVVLLVAAALFARSYAAHLAQDKGFDSAHLATVQVIPPPNSSAPSQPRASARRVVRDSGRADLEAALLPRLRTWPSVASVSRTDSLLPNMQYSLGSRLEIAGRATAEGWVQLHDYVVDPEYFETMGIGLRAGRWFGPGDRLGTLVVDEAFAQRFWPKGDAVGARLHMYVGFPGADESGQFEIVGVAAHVRGDSVENPTGDGVFVIYAQIPPDYSPLTFVMRMADGADLGPLTSMVRSVAKGCDVRSTRVDERYARLYGDARVAVDITSSFGLIALIIAVVGVYALMAFLVTGRTREIGIRMALGASPGDIRRLVLGSSIGFVLIGAVLGVAAAAAASHWVQAELFGVSALDPVTYCAVAALVVVIAVCAAWQPARLAARIAPALTLRAE